MSKVKPELTGTKNSTTSKKGSVPTTPTASTGITGAVAKLLSEAFSPDSVLDSRFSTSSN